LFVILRFDKERQIYTSKIGENLPHSGEILPHKQKADGDDNKPKNVPNGTFFLGRKFPNGGDRKKGQFGQDVLVIVILQF
jgi:hypothetical protein